MTIHIPSSVVGFLALAVSLALTWLCNRIAHRAVNKVLYREMQRLANLLPTVGVFILVDSWFVDSGLPMWLRIVIDVAITTFTLCVPFSGETTWDEKATSFASHIRLLPKHWHNDSETPTYC